LSILTKTKKNMRKTFNNETAVKIIKNSSWLVSDKIFTMIFGVLITAIVARYFGPEKFGQFNYAFAFVSLFTAISTLGLETLTVKSLIDKKYEEGTILCTSLILRLIGGGILTLLASLIIRVIEPNDANIHFLVLIMSMTIVLKALEVIEYWIQAHQKAKISSIIRMCAYVFTSIFKIILVVREGTIIQFAIIYSIDAAIIGFALIISYIKFRGNKSSWKFNFQYAINILSQSWYLILSGLMITLYMRIDQVMLGSMTTSKEVGIYSVAVRIAEMWYFVPMAIITSFKPVIMGNKNIGKEKYYSSIQLLYSIILYLGILFGLLTVIFSNTIVSILYGSEYKEAASILSLSVWAGTFAMLGSARSIWLLNEGLQKYTLVYTAVGLLINVTLNIILIPKIGAYGAAIGTLVAQVTNILVLFLFKNTRVSTIMILKAFIPTYFIKYLKNMNANSK
jgi:O-antigen/teichoic acid export membrane protein